MYGQRTVPVCDTVVMAPRPMFLTTVGMSSVKNRKMIPKEQETPIFPPKNKTCTTTGMSTKGMDTQEMEDFTEGKRLPSS